VSKERSWQDFRYKIPPEIPVGVRMVKNTVDSIASAMDIIIEMSKAAKLLLLAETDPLMMALTTLIDQLSNLLESLYVGFGTHLLILPVLATEGVPSDLIEVVDESGLDDLVGLRGTFRLDIEDYPILTASPPNFGASGNSSGKGGTWGFFQEFAATIYDTRDLSRPVYPEDSYVAGIVLMTGAKSLGSLLSKVFRLYNLLSELTPTPPGAYILPVPQNLTERIQGQASPDVSAFFEDGEDGIEDLHTIADISDGLDDVDTLSVYLRWDTVPILENIKSLFTGVTVIVTGVRVYMQVDIPIQVAYTPEKLASLLIFSTSNTSVQRLPVNGLKKDGSKTYYFAVGYSIEISEPDRSVGPGGQVNVGDAVTYLTTELEHYGVSNVVRVNPLHFRAGGAQSFGGKVPNWTALSSPLHIFPPLLNIILYLQDTLAFVRDNILSSKVDEFSEYIDFLTSTTQFYLTRVEALVDAMQELQNLVEALAFEGYLYPFAGKGGSRFLLSEVNTALFGDETLNKPPYEDSGDFVTGIVLVAAATGASTIDSFVSLLDMIFGDTGLTEDSGGILGGSLGSRSPSEAEDTKTAQDSLNVLLRDAEISVSELETLAGITNNGSKIMTSNDGQSLPSDLGDGGTC